MRTRPTAGRPPATSHAAIETAAFALFNRKGFDQTTTDDIADAARIGRRTLFRYFPSKNDIPWGQFDASLDHFRDTLAAMPVDVPVYQAVQRSVVEFNAFDAAALPQHRARMELILHTPSLQAHSVLMYARWRQVIADYVAGRMGLDPNDLAPRTVGHVCLALAIAAYEDWLTSPEARLDHCIDAAMVSLRTYVGDDV